MTPAMLRELAHLFEVEEARAGGLDLEARGHLLVDAALMRIEAEQASGVYPIAAKRAAVGAVESGVFAAGSRRRETKRCASG